MRLVKIWISILVFNNLALGIVIGSGLFPSTPGFFEDQVGVIGGNLNFTLNGTLDEVEQFSTANDILNVFRRGLTFDWVFDYMPQDMRDSANMVTARVGAGILALAINGIGIIELFMRRNDMLRGNR